MELTHKAEGNLLDQNLTSWVAVQLDPGVAGLSSALQDCLSEGECKLQGDIMALRSALKSVLS